MFCRKCGAVLRDTDKFCSQCGTPMETGQESVQLEKQTQQQENMPPMPPEQYVSFAEETETQQQKKAMRAEYKAAEQETARAGHEVPWQKTDEAGYEVPWQESAQEIRQQGETRYGQTGHTEQLYDERLFRDSFLDKKEEKSHALLVTVTVLLVIAVVTAACLVIFFFVNKNQPSTDQSGEDAIQIIADGNQAQGAEGSDVVTFMTEPSADGATQPSGGSTGENTGADGGTGDTSQSQSGASEPAAEVSTEAQTELQTETKAASAALDTAEMERIFSGESTASGYGIYVYDIKNSQEYSAGSSQEPMYASALITVPILYTAAVRLDQGTITLNDPITYVNSIGGRGEAYPEQKDGQSFPLSYYLTTMLTYSDNNCMNCLIDYFGLDVINSVCQQAGYTSVDLQRKIVDTVTDGKDNYISAKDLAGMVRELYRGKFQTLGSDFMKSNFKIDMGDGYRTLIGLAPELASVTTFLNQNGRGDTRYNETAVIAANNCEYIISIMCSGDFGFTYETAVQDISSYVYQSLNQ